jgi:hypothetical protein|tara:strand:+ start:332 stop:481 length:150 start_codon:yes stop_codon:yes gene_type:complete
MSKDTQDQKVVIDVLLSTIKKLREEIRTLKKYQGFTGDEVPYVNPSNKI